MNQGGLVKNFEALSALLFQRRVFYEFLSNNLA